jgi:hypothetical protein
VGFELTIPPFERAKTVHTLDRAATGIGHFNYLGFNISHNCDKDLNKKMSKFQSICGGILGTLKAKNGGGKEKDNFKIV